jgi:hypothetical protein
VALGQVQRGRLMQELHALVVATALVRAFEHIAIGAISTDLMTTVRLAMLASEWRGGSSR